MRTRARERRLCSEQEFAAVFNGRKRVSAAHVAVHWLIASEPPARLGITVPKRLLKRAVDRNRVKRVCREQFRAHAVSAKPVDCVVRLSQRVDNVRGKRLTEDVQAALNRLLEKLT